MKKISENLILIKTTYPNLSSAKKLAKILLQEKLAACVQFSAIESSYIWQGKIKNDHEILVSIKSKNSFYNEIEKIISKHHPYDIPQIFSIQANQCFLPYLDWINSSIKNPK